MIINEQDNPDKKVVKIGKQSIDKVLPNIPAPFPSKVGSVMVLSGAMGSGKSSLLLSMFSASNPASRIYWRRFTNVVYVTPEEAFSSEENHPFRDHPRVHHELTPALLEKITEDAIETKNDHGSTALILDDFSESMKSKPLQKSLQKLIFKCRHYAISIFITLVSLKALPKQLRALVSQYIVFRPRSIIETAGFVDEIFSMKQAEFDQLSAYVFDAPHNYLFYDATKHRYYKNMNALTITK
jgi:energy-coupling factor transporter ATP-binding protein EcfA2